MKRQKKPSAEQRQTGMTNLGILLALLSIMIGLIAILVSMAGANRDVLIPAPGIAPVTGPVAPDNQDAEAFLYGFRVVNEQREAVRRASIMVDFVDSGLPALRTSTGEDGRGSISFGANYHERKGIVTIKADGYALYTTEIFIQKGEFTQEIVLRSK